MSLSNKQLIKAMSETTKKETQHDSAHEMRRLYRSSTNRVLAGVAGGIGEYFEIDPTIIRFIFVIITIFGGSGIVLYLILWLIIPANEADLSTHSHISNNAKEMKEKAKQLAQEFRMRRRNDTSVYLGIAVIVIGLLFFLGNLGIIDFHQLWPIILILLGVFLLFKR